MPTVKINVKVTRHAIDGGFGALATRVTKNSNALAYNTAQRIEGGAKRRVHVITGDLKRSIHRVRLGLGNHRVIVGMYYGIYEEYGTRYRPPHPYFRPAVADARVAMLKDARKLFTKAGP